MYKKGTGKKSISRSYQNVNLESNRAEWDYKKSKVKWGDFDGYALGKILGKGTFSKAHKAVHKDSGSNVTVKILSKNRSEKIQREISVLKRIKGSKNNAHFFDAIKDESGNKCIVTNYYINDNLLKKNSVLSECEVKFYMYQLLTGLDEAHSRGVMHRDIKPSNIVINNKRKRLKIIDWGMGEFYHPYQEYHLKVGSNYYKAPELLLGMRQYDYSLDMWSFACIFAALVCNSFPFIKGKEEVGLLSNISGLLGENELWDYIEKYNLNEVTKEHVDAITSPDEESKLVFEQSTYSLKSDLALDLISKLLRVDHQERLTAREAMEHPYFDEIRKI